MNRSYRIIPTYTADVSGVCSALFELGGMVVIHDPSGCNSTYNTHDELRWYNHDSLIFISGLSELDAILGNDEKFIRDVVSAAKRLNPRFVALASSPIPYMNGTDFEGIAREIHGQTGITTFFVPTSGMKDYIHGAGGGLQAVARQLVLPTEERVPHSLNVLGATPLDFGTQEAVKEICRPLWEAGWKKISCWAMGDCLDTILTAGKAAVNLVISSVGLAAAQELHRRFGTPYVVGVPLGGFTPAILEALERAEASGEVQMPLLQASQENGGEELTLIGEPVTMGSLGAALHLQYGVNWKLLCPLEGCESLLRPEDRLVKGEEAAELALKEVRTLVADPLYRPICPPDVRLMELPHVAFSGRCFQWKKTVSIVDLINTIDRKDLMS